MAELTANDVENPVQTSAGQRLRHARESQQYSLEQASRHLHLDIQTLTSIEADETPDHIPITYLRGYLRAYAKWLDLPSEEIVAEFNRKHEDTTTLSGLQSLSALPASRHGGGGNWLKPALIGVVLLAIIGAGAFFLPGLWQLVAPMLGNDSETLKEQESVIRSEGSLPLNLAPVEPTAEEIPAAEPSAEELAGTATATVAPTTMAASTEPVTEAVTAGAEPLPGTAEVLQFSFNSECWVRVTDANDEVLAIGTKPAGHRMRVSGPAPLTVVLGNPTGVDLLHNGRPVDLSGYPTARSATVTINALTRE